MRSLGRVWPASCMWHPCIWREKWVVGTLYYIQQIDGHKHQLLEHDQIIGRYICVSFVMSLIQIQFTCADVDACHCTRGIKEPIRKQEIKLECIWMNNNKSLFYDTPQHLVPDIKITIIISIQCTIIVRETISNPQCKTKLDTNRETLVEQTRWIALTWLKKKEKKKRSYKYKKNE